MQLEVLDMLEDDHVGLALAYVGASVVGGFLAIAAATNVVRRARVTA
jgi:fluoride ion exporter CrcB/FEX